MKKIKLPLEMANGIMVRTLDELKENWDLEKIVGYFGDGRLVTWLNDRYYTDLADQVQKITAAGAEAQKELCAVFGMDFKQDEVVDAEALAERKRKLDILRQFTSDDEILKNVDHVAFNQEDLADLLDEGVDKIYLCNGKFSVPLIKNINYVGLGKVKVSIASSEICSFEELGIKFENIDFDENCKNYPDVIWQQAEDLIMKDKPREALPLIQKLADMNDKRGQAIMSLCYCEGGYGIEVDYKKALYYAELSAKQNYHVGYCLIAEQYENGYGVEKNIELAKENFKKAADLGDSEAMERLGKLYRGDWQSTSGGDYLEAAYWFRKAIEKGDGGACCDLGNMYVNGQGGLKDYKKAFELFTKGMKLGNLKSKGGVGWCYFTGNGVSQDKVKARQLIQEVVDENPDDEWAQNALKNWPW